MLGLSQTAGQEPVVHWKTMKQFDGGKLSPQVIISDVVLMQLLHPDLRLSAENTRYIYIYSTNVIYLFFSLM